MATRPSLPYFAASQLLPAPLPSVEEILGTESIVLRKTEKHTVVRIRQHFVVKYGQKVRLQEGENTLFVQQASNVPVPTIFALFHDEKTDQNFIIQEYIPGKGLDEVWSSLDQERKEAIVTQLRHCLDSLRSIPHPGYYGGVWEQSIVDFYMSGATHVAADLKDSSIKAVHYTEEEWVDAMFRRGEELYPSLDARATWISRIFLKVFQGHEPVFTHGDLDQSNIRIRDDGNVVLIDWERSGWYPSFWEPCLIQAVSDFKTDWVNWIPRFIDEYPAELGWMLHFRYWLFSDGGF